MGGHVHGGGSEFLTYITVGPTAASGSLYIQSTASQTVALTAANQSSGVTRSISLNFWYRY